MQRDGRRGGITTWEDCCSGERLGREDLHDYIGLTAEITEITEAVLISDLLPADAPDHLGADF